MARTMLTCRVSDAGVTAIEALAQQAGTTRSEMVRRLLALAIADPRLVARAIRPR